MNARTPEEFARVEPGWTTVSWFTLEARALRNYPKVRQAAVRFAPKEAWRDFIPERSSLLQPLLAVTQIVSVVLPALAAFSAVRSIWGGDDLDLGLVGILMATAALLALLGIVLSIGRPENSHPRTMRKVGFIHLVSAMVAGAIGVWAVSDGAISDTWGFVGIAMDLAIGVYLVVRIPKDEDADIMRRAGENLRKRTDELSASEKSAIVDEIRRAVAILSERGLIDESDVAKAHDAPAGYLALRMIAR